jgi:hypothetical protein
MAHGGPLRGSRDAPLALVQINGLPTVEGHQHMTTSLRDPKSGSGSCVDDHGWIVPQPPGKRKGCFGGQGGKAAVLEGGPESQSWKSGFVDSSTE